MNICLVNTFFPVCLITHFIPGKSVLIHTLCVVNYLCMFIRLPLATVMFRVDVMLKIKFFCVFKLSILHVAADS